MKKREQQKGGWLKVLGRIILFLLFAAAGFIGWNYLEPLVNSEETPIYESFTADRGDIETTISYSATISIINRQTVSGTMASVAGMRTTVRSIDVKESQTVKAGDQLAQLSNGEILTAEIDGVVNAINYSVGDRVRGNNAIMDICDFDNLQMSMSVDEYDIDSLKAGQACTVTVLPLGLSFETNLEHINRLSNGMGSVAYYQVTAKIDAPENVLPGMQASVSFPDQKAADVTRLDVGALTFREDGSAYVLKADSQGGYGEQLVETGLSDGMKVEIISGVEPGETVYAIVGTKKAEPAFTLESLYKQLKGETVIINDRTARVNRSNRVGMGQFSEGMSFPGGMAPPEGTTGPAGMDMQPPARQNEGTSREPQAVQGGNPNAT